MEKDALLKRKVFQNTAGDGRSIERKKKFLLKNSTFVGEKLENLNLCKNNNKEESQRKKKKPLALNEIFHVTYAKLPAHSGIL